MIDKLDYTPPVSISTISQPTPQQPSTDIYRTHIVSDPHEIRLYRNYQKARYQRTEFPTYFKEPNPSIKKFINLKLVHKKRENKEERIEGMTDKLHGNVARYVQIRGPLGIEQIAEVKECEKHPRNILIEGDPGVGKTTLVWELCKGWGENRLLHKWDVIVLIQLRDNRIRKAKRIEDIIYHPRSDVHKTVCDHIVETNGERWMFIFDGYDELSVDQQIDTSVFQQLLTGDLLPSASLIVTSRPLATRILPKEFKYHLHEHIEVVGFSDNDIDEYIKCKFCDDPDMLKDFQSYISCHPFIYKAMYIPLHCALVTDLYQTYWKKGKKEFAPKTITQLYTCFIHLLLERHLDDHPVYGPQELCVQELTDLPRDVYDDLMKLAELAANGIELQQYVFDNLTHNTLGLMRRVSESESRKYKSVSYSFLHLTLQEYLAALYWSNLSSEKVCHLFTESGILPVEKYIRGNFWAEQKLYRPNDSNIHWPVLHFYGGLVGIVGTPLETILVGTLLSRSSIFNILYLLFESQNPEYISTVLKENQYNVYVRSNLQGYITGYCISHCSSTVKWNIGIAVDVIPSMISGTSSSMHGGMISSLNITNVTDYSTCFQMLLQLERYTSMLSYLSLESHDKNVIYCDELSQLYRYYPKLQTLKLQIFHPSSVKRPNCTSFFSSLPLMTCLETLDLKGIVMDDSNLIVSNGLKQTSSLKSMSLSYCSLMNLSAEGLSQNNSLVSNKIMNITNALFEGIQQNKSLKQLSLSMIQLDKQKATVLKDALLQNTTLRKLTISHFIQSVEVAEVVAEGLQNSAGVTELQLQNIEGDDVFRTLIQGLRNNSMITSLCLTNFNLRIEGCEALKQVLLENKTLRKMILNRINSIETAEAIAEGLQNSAGVTELQLENFVRDDVIRTLIQGLRNNSMITSLCLTNFNLRIEWCEALKQVLLENKTLRKMILINCIMSIEIAEVVAEGLQNSAGVRELQLQNIEGDDVIRTLIQGLRNNSMITSLLLCNFNLHIEGSKALKQVLLENKTLRKMILINCIKSIEIAEVVAEGLQNSAGVRELQLQNIEGDDVIRTLIQGLRNNSMITSLFLWNFNLHIEGSKALKQVLLENKTLRKMILINCIKSIEIAEVVAEGLQNSAGVTELQLQNIEGDDVIRTLIQGLRNNSMITSLLLCNFNLHIEGSKALKQVLLENKTLRKMILINCIKSIEIAEVVAEGLQNSAGVTELQLQNIEGDDVIRTLMQGLRNNSMITLLFLANFNLHIEGSKALKQVLLENKTLRKMILINCIKSIEIAEVVAEGLQNSAGVRELNLENIERDDVIRTLIQGLRNNSVITSLLLGNFNLHIERSKALKQVLLENKSLRKMILLNCIKSIEIAEVVAEGLQNSAGVRQLQLQNIERDDVIRTLIQGLRNNSMIISLLLGNFNLHIEGSKALKQVLLENKTLRNMKLLNCIKSIEIAEVVAEGLQNSAGVRELQLDNIERDDVIRTLIQGLRNNSMITSLLLGNFNLHIEGSKALKQVLLENKTLRKMILLNCIKSIEIAEVVAEGLQNSAGVRELQLENIERDDVIRTLIQGLRNDSMITSLLLGNFNLHIEGSKALKQVLLENKTLRNMKLLNCINSIEIAEVVAEGLQNSAGVRELQLENIERDDVIRTLIQGLRNNSMIPSLCLANLKLHNEGSKALKQVLLENKSLRLMILLNCIKSIEIAEVVAEGLQNSAGVTELQLENIEGDDVIRTLIQGLRNNSMITSLLLVNFNLHIEGSKALKQVLLENKSLRLMILINCIKSIEIAEVVAEGLQNSAGVRELQLENIERDDVIRTLIQGLRNDSMITSLLLVNFNLHIEGSKALKQVLLENKTLRKMILINCIKSIEIAKVVVEGLQNSAGVRELQLQNIERDDVIRTLIQGLRNNSVITSLLLSNFNLHNEESIALKQVLVENKTLRKLILNNCINSIEVAEVVVDGLQNSARITELQLQNIEGDDVIRTLIQGLRNNSVITSLLLGNFNLHNEESIALKQVLLENKTLRKLILHNCINSIEIAEAVVDGLQNSAGITELKLQNIEGDDVIRTLIQGLRNNSVITSLLLRNFNLHIEGSIALKQVLLENKTLGEISLSNCIKYVEVAEVVADGLQQNTGITILKMLHIEGMM